MNKKEYPFKNLVFRGGGVKGIAYLGVLEVLEKHDILKNILRVSGSSTGAIVALLLSISKSFQEAKELIHSLEFAKVPEKLERSAFKRRMKKMPQFVQAVSGNLSCMIRLKEEFGWFSTAFFHKWTQQVIDTQFQKYAPHLAHKKGKQNFQDFQEAGFREMYISVTNINKHRNEIFSHKTQPKMAVADAVRASISIPFFFEAHRINQDFYIDGGVANNYPINIFDRDEFKTDNSNFKDGTNWETLGCYLIRQEDCRQNAQNKNKQYGFLRFVQDLFLSVLAAQEENFKNNPSYYNRSVKIFDSCANGVEFNLSPEDEMYQNLVNAGRQATEKYLSNYVTTEETSL